MNRANKANRKSHTNEKRVNKRDNSIFNVHSPKGGKKYQIGNAS